MRCGVALAGPGQREAAIRPPLEVLLRRSCDAIGLSLELYSESPVDGPRLYPDGRIAHQARTDYMAAVNGAIIGHVEVKRPETDIDPPALTGHNRQQWQQLKDLPNLLYTNGRQWALYRNGERVGEVAELDGDLATAGRTLSVHDGHLERLLRDFYTWRPVPIRTARQLVRAVAPLCRLLRREVSDQLGYERLQIAAGHDGARLPFTGLADDWRHLLVPSADDGVFADHYAQVVTFALLLAQSEDIPLEGHSLHEIGDRLGHRHSVMGQALQVLTDTVFNWFRDTLNLLVRVIAAVRWTDIHTERSDAYLYLYEDFLEVYDQTLRRASGSYYTPPEVVTEMVRLVEEVLRTRLGFPEGFRSPEVVTIDPAMGTGTFLHAIIERVADQVAEEEGAGAVRHAVEDAAPRLIGFDSQICPFAVAELRMSAMLRKYEARPPDDGLPMYVTNTLDNPHLTKGWFPQLGEVLARSQKGANDVKLRRRATVVMGNPPYRERAKDLGLWVENGTEDDAPSIKAFQLAEHGRTAYVLKNLYVYFWRWATWKLFDHDAGHDYGVVAFISTAGYLRGAGFKGMREYLRRTCDEGWIIDFSPEGMQPDVATRIFPGVQQPLVLALFVRTRQPEPDRPAHIRYTALHSQRGKKHVQLRAVRIDGPDWVPVREEWQAPFTPAAGSGWDEYPALGDLIPWAAPGVKANRTWVYAPQREILERRWKDLVSAESQEHRAALFKVSDDRRLDSQVDPLPGGHRHSGTIGQARGDCPPQWRIAYRSFDRQWIVADNRLIDRPRPALWRALRPGNIFVSEQHAKPLRSGPGIVLTTLIQDMDHFKGSEGGRVLPMRHATGAPNLAAGLLDTLAARLGRPVSDEDLIAYFAAVAAHRGFTARFAGDLVTPGIRVPLSADPALWTEAVSIGREACWVQTYGDAFSDWSAGRPIGEIRYPAGDARRPQCPFPVDSAGLPATIHHDPTTDTLHVGTGTFTPVPAAVWEYDVGGAPVVRKWFSYRKASPGGRASSKLDAIHTDRWPFEWTVELNELLTLLRRLVELEPAQADLLDRIVAGPLITVAELTAAGVFPVNPLARRPYPATNDDLFSAK